MSKTPKVVKVSRHELMKRFQLNGFNLKSDAITAVESEFLSSNLYSSLEEFIKDMSQALMLQCRSNSIIVDVDAAQAAIDSLKQSKRRLVADQSFVVKNVVSETTTRTFNYLHHYQKLFKKVTEALLHSEFQLTPIDKLLKSDVELDCVVLAFLRKNRQKVYGFDLEDPSGSVPIYLDNEVQCHNNLIVENSFVLVEGHYDPAKDILDASSIGLPPIFAAEEEQINDRIGRMLVFIHDIYLDDENTLKKLKILLTGYNATDPVPDCFILIGEFTSDGRMDDFRVHMRSLVKLISSFPNIASQSQIIIVPGGNYSEGGLPIPAFSPVNFPSSIATVTNFHLTTNPVNIYIDGRHICVYAYPCFKALKKFTVIDQTRNVNDFGVSYGKILSSNAHLTAGLSREFHSSLSLWHVPDAIVLADRSSDKKFDCSIDSNSEDGISFAKLPSFSGDNFMFKVYYTSSNKYENSQILM